MKKVIALNILLLCLYSCKGQDVPDKTNSIQVYQSGTSFLKRTENLAGQGAIDCGDTEANPKNIYNCISVNYKEDKSFFVYYSVQGIDSVVWVSVAFDGESLFILHHDTYGLQEKYAGYKCFAPELVAYSVNIFNFDALFVCA